MSDPTAEADVLVVCVTYNSARVVNRFLAGLPGALAGVPSCRVVVTDNNSSDGTPDVVRDMAPWATLIEAGYNGGYAAGINLALQGYTARRAVYVLNPDTVPSAGSIALLLLALEDPAIGVVTPRILDAEGNLQYSLRREPTIPRAIGEALLGGERASRCAWLGETISNPRYYRNGVTADWATGAAMFISRRAIDTVGAWDERFFLYSEETDYALRVKDAGLRLLLLEDAMVTHIGGDMAESPYLWSLEAVNRTRLYRMRHTLVPSIVYWSAVLVNEAVRVPSLRQTHRAALRALLHVGPNQPSSATTPSLLNAH